LTGDDPFDSFAEQEISAPVRRKMQAKETRRERAIRKAQLEKELVKEWTGWNERKKELLTGPYAHEAQELADFLKGMTLEDGENLIARVEQGPWQQADSDIRFLVFELVSSAIIHLREKSGLDPFDDPIPSFDGAPEETSVFQIVHRLLGDRPNEPGAERPDQALRDPGHADHQTQSRG
jgi:hypothetical protein